MSGTNKLRHRKRLLYAVARRWVIVARWIESVRHLNGAIMFDVSNSPFEVQNGDLMCWRKQGSEIECTVRRYQ